MSEKEYFLVAHKEFDEKHGFVSKIFSGIPRTRGNQRLDWANLLFARLGMVGNSMLTLCDADLSPKGGSQEDFCVLDHNSLATLGRGFLEAWVMFVYVSDPAILNDEWLLRRAVIELHYCISRRKLLKHLGDKRDVVLSGQIDSLKKTILSSSIIKGLNPEDQKKILDGQSLYINGARAVVRNAGWDVNGYDANYTFLCSHAHSGPLSFTRSFLNPSEPASGFDSDDQYRTAGLVFEYLTMPLSFACERMFLLYPDVFLTGETKH